MNAVNIFEQATRQKLRFESPRGELTVEQLWDLPLQVRDNANKPSLDNVAVAVYNSLKAVTETSFVATAVNPAKPELELKMEVIKSIIATRMEENAAKTKREENKAKRERLIELLDKKEQSEMEGMSKEEIRAQLAAIED